MTAVKPSADRLIAVAVWAASLAWLWSFDPLSRPLVLDPATWDYMSTGLVDGLIPYRDVFLHKTPGAIFIGALGAALAAPFGATAVAGAHTAFVVLGAAGPALLYLLARRHMDVVCALAAAAFMLAVDQWPVAALEGVRPKVATTVLGLAGLLAASSGRPLAGGALAGASALCWQPGVAFGLGVLWETRSGRMRSWLRVAAGAALPLACLLVWLATVGALDDFVRQAIAFNVHYVRIHARTPASTLVHLGSQLAAWNGFELVLLPLAALGLLRGRAGLAAGLAVAGLAYLAMVFVSFQAWPDTILFAPVLAAMLAAGLFAVARGVVGVHVRRAAVLALALVAMATPHSKRLHPPIDFAAQRAFMNELAAGLGDDDSVVVVSLPEFLVHTGKRSRWTWPYMWFGVDRQADASTEGGFDALLADLDRDPPALMLVARRWRGPLRQKFEAWARSRYTREQVWVYPHTVRPINVYRPREHQPEPAQPAVRTRP